MSSPDNGYWPGATFSPVPLGPIGVSGGTRDRLIHDSIWQCLYGSLNALGWFTPSATRLPVTLLTEQLEWDKQIDPNVIALDSEQATDQEWELGDDMRQNTWTFFVTIVGENDSVSRALAGDVRDIIRGKIASIGRGNGPIIDIVQWNAATPYKVAWVQTANCVITRPVHFQRWQRYLRDVTFEVQDYYDSDLDTSDWAFQP